MAVSTIHLDQQSTNTPSSLSKASTCFFGACLILGPLLPIVSVFLNPDRTVGSNSGSAVIAAHMAAGTGLSPLDFFIMVVELFLLPFGVLGMTLLAMRRSPWLASIGGFLSITGYMAFVVFVGQEVQSRLMAQMGSGAPAHWKHPCRYCLVEVLRRESMCRRETNYNYIVRA